MTLIVLNEVRIGFMILGSFQVALFLICHRRSLASTHATDSPLDPSELMPSNSHSCPRASCRTVGLWSYYILERLEPQQPHICLAPKAFGATFSASLGLESHVRPRVQAYLGTICRALDAELVHVGGVADLVHIVTTLPRTISQAQLIEQTTFLKSLSSSDRKTNPHLHPLPLAKGEARGPSEHYRTRTFHEEYRELLRRHGLDFDERYVWN